MSSEQFDLLLMAIGFGLGSIFWLLLFYVCLKAR